MIIGARTGCWAKSGYTALDYVGAKEAKAGQTSPLVAMWSGMENAGWGQHDNGAPVNLITGIRLNTVGSTITTATTFDAPQGAYYYSVEEAFRLALNNKDFTLEIVASAAKDSNNGIFSIGNRGIWVYASRTNNVSTINCLAVNYQEGKSTNYNNDGIFRLTIVGGSRPKIYLDDVEYQFDYGTLSSVPQNQIYIGTMNGQGVFTTAIKKFCNVRLYVRNLTAAEIAANSVVDKALYTQT